MCLSIVYAAIAALCGFALYWLGGFLGSFDQFVLIPIFKFLKDYFENYGRMTAAVILGLILIGGGLCEHFNQTRLLTEKHNEALARQERQISTLIQNHQVSADKLLIVSTELERSKGELNRKYEKIKTQDIIIENLHQDIERLKNPEKVAMEEIAKDQQSKDEKLKTIVNSIQWGRS